MAGDGQCLRRQTERRPGQRMSQVADQPQTSSGAVLGTSRRWEKLSGVFLMNLADLGDRKAERGGFGEKRKKKKEIDGWHLVAGGAPLCPQVLHRCLWSRASTSYPGTLGPAGVSPTALASAQPSSKSNYTWHRVGTWWMPGNKDRNLTWFSLFRVQWQQIK